MAPTPLQQLREYGQSPWLDGFSRDLDRLRREHGICGVTRVAAADAPAACDVMLPL